MIPDKIGRKLNKIVIAGVKYKAETSHNCCVGCAMRVEGPAACPVSADGDLLCTNRNRQDDRHIVWVEVVK